MVLAHSLRDNGTKARLIVLYTPDRLRQETIAELKVCSILNCVLPKLARLT